MGWLLQLLINAAVLVLTARIIPSIKIRSYGTAIMVALVIGLLNATVGFILRLSLNLVTLWLLSFFVRLLVLAIVIKIADKLFDGFEVKSFGAALLLALIMAIVGSVLSWLWW